MAPKSTPMPGRRRTWANTAMTSKKGIAGAWWCRALGRGAAAGRATANSPTNGQRQRVWEAPLPSPQHAAKAGKNPHQKPHAGSFPASSLNLRLPFKNKQSGPLTSKWCSARLGIGILCYSMTLSRERWSPSWQLARQGSLGFRLRPHTISICLLVSRSVNQYRLAGRVWADNSGRM